MPLYINWLEGSRPVLAETLKVLSIIGIPCSGQIFHVQQQIKQTWKQTKVWLSFKLNLRLGKTQHFGQICAPPPPLHPHHHSLCSPCQCGSSDCSLWQNPFHRCCSGTVGSSTAQSGTRGFGGVAVGWTAGWRRDRTLVCGTCTAVHLQNENCNKATSLEINMRQMCDVIESLINVFQKWLYKWRHPGVQSRIKYILLLAFLPFKVDGQY